MSRGLRIKTAVVANCREAVVQIGTAALGQRVVRDESFDRLELGVWKPSFERDGKARVGFCQPGTQGQCRPRRRA